jgi:hypothetical protein
MFGRLQLLLAVVISLFLVTACGQTTGTVQQNEAGNDSATATEQKGKETKEPETSPL